MAEISELELRVKGTGIETTRRQLNRLTDEGRSRFGRLKAAVFSVKGALATLGVGLGLRLLIRQISDVVEVGGRFEQSLTNIGTLIGTRTGPQILNLKQGFFELLRVIPTSADDLGAAAYQVFSAGISDTSQALKVLKASGKLAVAGLGTTAEAVDLMTSAINVYGESADRADEISNIFFKTVRAGKTTVGKLASGFGSVAKIAAEYNIELEELQAATAALSTQSGKTAEEQRNLRGVIIGLIRPTGEMEKIYKRLGITNIELELASRGLVPTLRDVVAEIKRSGFSAARTIGTVEGLGAALSLSGSVAKKFDEILEDLVNGTDDLGRAFEDKSMDIISQTQKMENEFLALKVTFFDAIAPSVRSLIALLSDAARALDEFANRGGRIKRIDEGKATLIDMQKEIKALEQELGPLFAATESIGARLFGPLPGIGSKLAEVQGRIVSLREDIDDLETGLGGLADTSGPQQGVADLGEQIDKATGNIKSFVASLKQQEEALTEQRLKLTRGEAAALDYTLRLQEQEAATLKLSAADKQRLASIRELSEGLLALKEEEKRELAQMEDTRRALDFQGDRIRQMTEVSQSLIDLERQLTLEVASEADRRVLTIQNEMEQRLELVDRALAKLPGFEERAVELRVKIHENAIVKIKDGLEDLNEFWVEALRNIERAGSDFLFNLFEGNIGSFEDFANSLRSSLNRMAADILSAQLLSKAQSVFGGALGIPGSQASSATAATAAIQAEIAVLQATAQTGISTTAATGQTALQTTSATAQGGIQAMLTEALTAIQAIQATALAAIQAASAGKAVSGGSFLGALFGGGGGGGGGFGGGGGVTAPDLPLPPTVPFGHRGGIVGSADMAMRLVNPAVFSNAEHYRFGGITGLRPNEVPIVAHRGEEILREDDPRHVRRGGRRGGSVVFTRGAIQITSPDANSFLRSPSQIEAQIARAVRRGMKRL